LFCSFYSTLGVFQPSRLEEISSRDYEGREVLRKTRMVKGTTSLISVT
jgi:hypothetical protein